MKHVAISISLLILVIAFWGCDRATSPSGASASAREIGTVDLTVDFGGAREIIEKAIPCSENSTVFTTLERADLHGDLELDASGNGETAFVNGINGLAGDAKRRTFWFFYVNGQLAKQGCGAVQVDPGDKIQWRYQQQPAEFEE